MEDAGAARRLAGPEHLHLEDPRPEGPAPTGEAKPPPPPCRPSLVRPPFPSAPAGRRELRPRERDAVGGPRSWMGSCPSGDPGCPCPTPLVQLDPDRDSNYHDNIWVFVCLFFFFLASLLYSQFLHPGTASPAPPVEPLGSLLRAESGLPIHAQCGVSSHSFILLLHRRPGIKTSPD